VDTALPSYLYVSVHNVKDVRPEGKGEVVPLHAMKAHTESGGLAPQTPNLNG
jgi:hypothetical protein